MGSRESKNPVTGRRSPIVGGILFFTIVSTLLHFLLFWSFYSVDRAGLLSSATGFAKFALWIGQFFQTPLCRPDEGLWIFFRENLALFFALDGFVILLFLAAVFRPGNFKGIEYGSAHWATNRELRPFRHKKNNMPLAHKVYLAPETGASNNNVLVLASPGGGKTFNVIIPAIEALTRPGYSQGSFLCTDTKGALYRDTSKMVRERGIPVYLLNLSNPWFSDGYNPLYLIHEEKKVTEIDKLALAYTKNVRDEEAAVGDAIWESTFKQLMFAVWMYQYDFTVNPLTGQAESKAMWRTAELVLSIKIGDDGTVDRMAEFPRIIEAIRRMDPAHPSVRNFDYVTSGAAETISSVIFTAGSKISIFTYPEIEAMMDHNEIPLDQICESPGGIYLNFEIGSPYKAIAALFIEQLMTCAYYVAERKYSGRLPLNLKLFLDELPNICKVYSLPERASTSRSYNIDLIVSIQSMQQLKRMFRDAEKTLMNNCVTQVYLGTGEADALKQISEALGKTTTSEVSYSRSVGGNRGSNSDSQKATGREIALPNEIYTMPKRYAIVIMQNQPPIFAEKFKTQNEKYYKELGGKGNPQNNRVIEEDYRAVQALRKAEYYRIREERISRIRQDDGGF